MKFFAILFSIIVMTLAIVPCCTYDNCDEEQTEGTRSTNPETPCSPFVNCTCSPSAVCIPPCIAFNSIPVTEIAQNKTNYRQSLISVYYSTIWQPPKLAC
jgi:hypothetical protein